MSSARLTTAPWCWNAVKTPQLWAGNIPSVRCPSDAACMKKGRSGTGPPFRICEGFKVCSGLATAVNAMQGQGITKKLRGRGLMDIKKRDFLLAGAVMGAAAAATGAMAQGARARKQPSSVDMNYKPRRLNKCVELWEEGQPIYYTGWGMGTNV